MITIPEFRQKITDSQIEFLLEEIMLAPGAKHVSDVNIQYIASSIAMKYGINEKDLEVCITGSAKLGFSLVEKRQNGNRLPRYRDFSANSDIDVAVISKSLFEIIWTDLSTRGFKKAG